MAAPAKGRGGWGWAVLAAALAVPGLLFYNWWARLKAEHDSSVAAKARSRLPQGGVFNLPPPSSARLVNPIASAAAPPPPRARSIDPGALPAPAAAAATLAPPQAAPPPAAAPEVAFAAPASSAAAPTRDPTLSPLDVVHLREAELERERNERALRETVQGRPAKRRRARREAPIESRIELQGVVTNPDGQNMAIVDGASVAPGQDFSVGGYPGRVRVVRISAAGVVFEHRGRRFKMQVNVK